MSRSLRATPAVDRIAAAFCGTAHTFPPPPVVMSTVERLLGLGAYNRWREAQAPEVFQ